MARKRLLAGRCTYPVREESAYLEPPQPPQCLSPRNSIQKARRALQARFDRSPQSASEIEPLEPVVEFTAAIVNGQQCEVWLYLYCQPQAGVRHVQFEWPTLCEVQCQQGTNASRHRR